MESRSAINCALRPSTPITWDVSVTASSPMNATRLANSFGPTPFVVDSDVPGFKCIADVGLQLPM